MARTIKQLADELGVSKTAIRKKMTEEFREKYVETTENGTLLVSDEGANLLEILRKSPRNTENKEPETTENQLPQDRESWYMAQIDSLRKENEELRNKLLELSGQVGDALTFITQGQLADKLLEGRKISDESSVDSDKKPKWKFWRK